MDRNPLPTLPFNPYEHFPSLQSLTLDPSLPSPQQLLKEAHMSEEKKRSLEEGSAKRRARYKKMSVGEEGLLWALTLGMKEQEEEKERKEQEKK